MTCSAAPPQYHAETAVQPAEQGEEEAGGAEQGEEEAGGAEEGPDPREYTTFLSSRPDVMELEAIRTVTELCLQYQ